MSVEVVYIYIESAKPRLYIYIWGKDIREMFSFLLPPSSSIERGIERQARRQEAECKKSVIEYWGRQAGSEVAEKEARQWEKCSEIYERWRRQREESEREVREVAHSRRQEKEEEWGYGGRWCETERQRACSSVQVQQLKNEWQCSRWRIMSECKRWGAAERHDRPERGRRRDSPAPPPPT